MRASPRCYVATRKLHDEPPNCAKYRHTGALESHGHLAISRRSRMTKLFRLARTVTPGFLAAATLAVCLHAQTSAPPPSRPPVAGPPSASAAAVVTAASSARRLVDRYCVTCHNERLKTADLTLDRIDVDTPGGHADIWEKVVRKV